MKKLLLALFFVLIPVLALADTRTPIATDDFNRADGAIGANYTSTNDWDCTGFTITSNQVAGSHNAALGCSVRWTGAGTFTNDQYASVRLVGVINNYDFWTGVTCRASADSDTSGNNARDHYEYALLGDPNPLLSTVTLAKMVNGVRTILASGSAVGWAQNDLIEIECIGTTIRGLRNGTELLSVTDATLTTGQPGMLAAGIILHPLDDFSAGSLVASGGGGAGNVRHRVNQ